MTAPVQRYTNQPLIPVVGSPKPVELAVNIAPNQTIVKGTVLAQVTASASDVQTITMSGSGGTFTISGVNPLTGLSFTTAALAYNIPTTTTATNLQAVLNALFAPGTNVTVTGTAGSSYVITFGSNIATMPVQLMTLGTSLLTGGSATIAHTTYGAFAGTYAPYSILAAPTVAPTVAVGTSTSDPPSASNAILWTYTYYDASGETTPSPAASLAPDGTHAPTIASIAVPTGATGIRYYANGNLITSKTAAGVATITQTLLTASLSAVKSPTTNTTSIAACLAKYDMATDSMGQITMGGASGGSELGTTYTSLACYFSGWFRTQDLTGLDANAVTQLGKLKVGTTTSGVLAVVN
jgi:hypothetical protein